MLLMMGEKHRPKLGGLTRNNKNKAIPLQVWTGPVGSRRLRISDFKTIGT
jgi:hypothetical protein